MSYFWELGDTRLRPLREDDLEDYLAADRDSEGKRVLNGVVGLPRSSSSQAKMLPVEFKNAPERLDFAIETADEVFVGFCAIDQIDEQSGNFSTVTYVAESFRRKGHAERAKHLMLGYMFDERRFEKYNTDCVETNEAMLAHLKKLGCIEEGRRRRRTYSNGRYYDELLFGMTREEWNQRSG